MKLRIYNKMSFLKNRNRIILLAANILLVFFLILLSNLHILPVGMGDFIFFAFLTLSLALYRPGWVFLFFVGTVMIENVNLAPAEIGIAVRPYQFFGGLVVLALGIRFFTKKLNFNLIRLNVYDWLIIFLGAASFVSAVFSNNIGVSLKQSIVLSSFIFLYFLVRNYVQSLEDVKKIMPFFLSSSAAVVLYGIWQNVRFAQKLSDFEVMPGRPNGTFTEADWYGIFLAFLLAVIYALIYFSNDKNADSRLKISNKIRISPKQVLKIFLFIFLVLIFIALILTVSRSAWLGALAVIFIFLMVIFTDLKFNFRSWQWKKTAQIKIPILLAAALSVALVYALNLTSFQLFNRVQSTGTGLQEITISCENGAGDWKSVPVADTLVIENTNELDQYHCRHINLEDIDKEAAEGRFVTVAFRKDPNINIRQEIYKKSWAEIRNNFVLGIGWGNIADVLGKDERGAGLNSSNIFLETWLGAGILGFLAFVAIWIGVIIRALRLFLDDSFGMKTIGIFLLLGAVAIIVPNIFNAGIMLGFFWLFLGSTFINKEK